MSAGGCCGSWGGVKGGCSGGVTGGSDGGGVGGSTGCPGVVSVGPSASRNGYCPGAAPQIAGSKPAGNPGASWAVSTGAPPALVFWPVVCRSQYELVAVPGGSRNAMPVGKL